MHSGTQADQYGVRDQRADDVNRPEDDGDSEDVEDLEDDDFIDHDVEDADAPTDPGADRLSRSLLFIIAEIGAFKTNADGREVYVPGKGCLNAVRDIIKYCRHDNPKDPMVKHYLGKWETLRKDLVPLFFAQKQNKKVIYYVLTLIAYLTNPLEPDCVHHAEHKAFLETYKELLSYAEFSDDLVLILGETEQIPNKTKAHENLIEVIVTIIRNILLIECRSTSTLDAYKDNLQKKLYQNFTKSGGVFDAITYLCQNMQGAVQKRLRLVYLEIFYSVLASFPASFIVETGIDKEYFKSLREREKLNQQKRRSELSSRHSRFGAMFQVKRTIGSTSAITSTLNFARDQLNKLDVQRVKPKPNSRYATNRDTQIFAPQAFGHAKGILNEEDRNLQLLLKRFVIDFLEHSYGPLIDSVHDCLQKDLVAGNPADFLHFFVVTAFGIEVYNLEFESFTSDRPQESTLSRPQVEDSMTCKFAYVIHGVQVTLIEMLYRSFIGEIAKKRSEFNTKLFHACLYYLNQILTSTHILSRSTAIHDQRNAKVLKEVIFSKEFAKILKIGFDYFEPKLHGVVYVENLMTVQDAFFNLLAQHAKDRILSAKTDKVVKKAQRRQKKRALETARAAAADIDLNEDGTPVGANPTELEEESDEEDAEEDYVFKERKYNYYSEFSSFVDYATIAKVLGLIKGDRLLWNSKRLNAAIYNYMNRIVNDLKGEWVFFQNDFLALLAEVVDNFQIAGSKDFSGFIQIIRNITKQFFNYLSKNPMLAVEAMFRFPDLITKDQILNNYEIVIPVTEDLHPGTAEPAKQSLPWTREEDVIIVENFEYYKDDPEPWVALVKVLRDQAYFRNAKDVKFRVKLLKADKNKDVALEIVKALHSNKQSLEEVVVRMLLYTTVKGRELEQKTLRLLKGFAKEFAQHKNAFSNYPCPLPLLPILEEEFEVLELQFVPVMLDYIGLERPCVGRVWWRANPDTEVEERVLQIEMEYERLKNKPESELLDLGDKEESKRRKAGNRVKKGEGADEDLDLEEALLGEDGERKGRKANSRKVNKRETRRLQKAREREAIIKLNREIAGLGSEDEALEVMESASEHASDEESSHKLDYVLSEEEKPAAKVRPERRGMDIEFAADAESSDSQRVVAKKRRLTKAVAAPSSDEEN